MTVDNFFQNLAPESLDISGFTSYGLCKVPELLITCGYVFVLSTGRHYSIIPSI
jgi:hypothetical protein